MFVAAGADERETVFVAGFGNHNTDAFAYEAAGVRPHSIFIISPTSALNIWGSYSECTHIHSYTDNRLMQVCLCLCVCAIAVTIATVVAAVMGL